MNSHLDQFCSCLTKSSAVLRAVGSSSTYRLSQRSSTLSHVAGMSISSLTDFWVEVVGSSPLSSSSKCGDRGICGMDTLSCESCPGGSGDSGGSGVGLEGVYSSHLQPLWWNLSEDTVFSSKTGLTLALPVGWLPGWWSGLSASVSDEVSGFKPEKKLLQFLPFLEIENREI